jgi:hypothetical protein
MEAERVATEGAVEPEREVRPAEVPLARSPAEFVRALSRTYGNRRVAQALALARQPTATAPAPAIAKGYKAVPVSDARWQKVDDLLTWTQLGWEARQVMRDHSVPLAEAALPTGTPDTGAPAFYDAKGNVCYLNLSSTPAEISAYFVHEMHHAKQARTGKSPGAEGFPNTEEHRRKWVAVMVEEEVVGTAMGFEHKRRLENRGLADKNDRPAGMSTYRRIYNMWKDKALAAGKDEVAAAAEGREKALIRVRFMIANPGGRASPELGPPGGVGESYEDFYAREFRRATHPAAP